MQQKLDTLSLKEEFSMDYYRILGIPKEADEEQIKQAYRSAAKKYHPDLNPDNPEAEARFKEIAEAYAVLSDSKKRREYDLEIEKCTQGNRARAKEPASSTAPEMDLVNLTKNMERYFGFSFKDKKAERPGQGAGYGNKKNPLDMTELFEAYMKLK